ncbi:hypothetical protein V8G54_006600 [Vigna mungo]|uniref:Retrovirus-related Pol polyprotein from transposon TNT 1-94 n=1 Tax=Vigna mungo TaxID=3915 RepID=A0AAQ3S7I1_VIGMU
MKWTLRYLIGTSRVCLCFGSGKLVLNDYTDVYMTSDVDSRKYTFVYMMNFARGAMSWQSILQKCVVPSSTEAKYIVVIEVIKKLFWMQKFLQELGLSQEKYVLYCDSQSAIHLGNNSTSHLMLKYIEVDVIGYEMH